MSSTKNREMSPRPFYKDPLIICVPPAHINFIALASFRNRFGIVLCVHRHRFLLASFRNRFWNRFGIVLTYIFDDHQKRFSETKNSRPHNTNHYFALEYERKSELNTQFEPRLAWIDLELVFSC